MCVSKRDLIMLVLIVQVGLILLQLMVIVFECLLKYAFFIVGLLVASISII